PSLEQPPPSSPELVPGEVSTEQRGASELQEKGIAMASTGGSIISVASYLSLAALAITISLRGYSKVLQLVRRGDGHHPFQAQLDADFGLSKEQLERLTERFAFLFYVLTYVGAVFNGLTLLILGVISAFTFPLLYRQHQAQIDQYVELVRNQLSNLRAKMLAILPTAKAKAE
ncbi:hypothetical protein E2320_000873, partial [Naja naja]